MTGPAGNELVVPRAVAAGYDWPMIEPQTASATGVVVAGELLLAGWAFAETSGIGAATVDLFDGSSVGGQFIARIALNPGQSIRDMLPPVGLHCEVGLFVNVVAGVVLGSVWVVPL